MRPMRSLRFASSSLLTAGCTFALVGASQAGCATAVNNGSGLDAGGTSLVIPTGDAARTDASGIVIVGGSDTGTGPVIIAATDSGGSGGGQDVSSPPTMDATVTMDSTAPTMDVAVPPPMDSGNTSHDAGMMTGDAGGCGFTTGVAACDSCLTASCCTSETACASDTTCSMCETAATPASSCSTNAKANAFNTCASTNCASQCGASGGDAGGGVPTTCAAANQGIGCCANNVNYYCTTSGTVGMTDCSSLGKTCSWSGTQGDYTCTGASTPKSDPSGTNPIACQ